MANKKISQLTAKGTALAATDLVEIAEDDGAGGYVTKSVTGANVVSGLQATLVSATNIKTINSNSIVLDTAGTFCPPAVTKSPLPKIVVLLIVFMLVALTRVACRPLFTFAPVTDFVT